MGKNNRWGRLSTTEARRKPNRKLVSPSRTSRRRYQSLLTGSWVRRQLGIPLFRPSKISNRLDSESVRLLPMPHPAFSFRAIRCVRANRDCLKCRFAHLSHAPTHRCIGLHTTSQGLKSSCRTPYSFYLLAKLASSSATPAPTGQLAATNDRP